MDWIESGCRPLKKLRNENLAKLGIAEAKLHNKVELYCIPGATNMSNIFTKEDNNVSHYCNLRDHMLVPREEFGLNFTHNNIPVKPKHKHKTKLNNHHNDRRRWGVLKYSSDDNNDDDEIIQSDKETIFFGSFDDEVKIPAAVPAVASE